MAACPFWRALNEAGVASGSAVHRPNQPPRLPGFQHPGASDPDPVATRGNAPAGRTSSPTLLATKKSPVGSTRAPRIVQTCVPSVLSVTLAVAATPHAAVLAPAKRRSRDR